MFCSNCGKEIPNGQMICNFCGGYVNSTANMNQNNNQQQNQNYNQQQNQNYNQQLNPNYSISNLGLKTKGFVMADANGQGMKWFKFIIYVQLFLNFIVNGIVGIMVFGGQHYDGADAKLVYKIYDKLETVDKLYGIVLIVLAILALVVRARLANFRQNAGNQYLYLLLANLIASVLYYVAVIYIVKADVSPSYSNIVTSIFLLAANVTYFNNRKYLFIN